MQLDKELPYDRKRIYIYLVLMMLVMCLLCCNSQPQQSFAQEVAIMSMLEEHPHIISLKQVLYAPHRLYLVTGMPLGLDSKSPLTAGPPAAQPMTFTEHTA